MFQLENYLEKWSIEVITTNAGVQLSWGWMKEL
jgi:hypothetical protein